MRIAYPKSFLKLLLIGFALAMLPLLVAFGNAALYLDQLAEQSRITVTQAVQATRASRILVEQIMLMERSARQYFVLNDNLLLDNFRSAHEKFSSAVGELSHLSLGQAQRNTLEKLSANEAGLYSQILSQTPAEKIPESMIAQFIELSDQAQEILAESNLHIDRESAVLAETAASTQKMLLWQTLTLIPIALLVALAITFLVAQPLKQIDASIRRLGEAEYEEPIIIDGPGDLRVLGERLDWLRSQLSMLEQQKQRFLRHISHELKTPLTAIREGSELLSDGTAGSLSPQQKEIAGILRDSSLRLQKMIENLLHYNAVQYQNLQLRYSRVTPETLLEQILVNYSLSLGNKQIVIERNLENFQLYADEEKLITIIDNLISNAIKYTPQGGHILISARKDNQMAMIEVHDGGPGVMAADKAKLFDPFYRGDGVYESLVSGSGLGLSIAKEYVEAHGGEIRLLPSEQGAHFVVRLPLKAKHA